MRQISRFLTLNGTRLTNIIKRQCVHKFLKKENPAYVCLQETHLKAGKEKRLKQLFKGSIFHAHSQTRAKGVMISIAENATWVVKEILRDKLGRHVTLRVLWATTELILVGIYAAHIQQAQFWEEVFNKVSQMGTTETIIFGDFNATVKMLDRSNKSKSLEVPKIFKENMALWQLEDVWRARNLIKRDYIYFSKSHLSHSRIGYVLVSPKIDADVTTAKIGD